jgi:hypothetical protein
MTANSGFSQPSKFVGSDECSRYQSRDKRPLPPARRMLSAFFDVEGSGYVLKVNYDGENRVASYRFDSDLKFKYEDRNQLKISSEGKFKFSIDHRAESCGYSGTAKMSPQASARIFGQRSGSNDFPTSSSVQIADGIYINAINDMHDFFKIEGSQYLAISLGENRQLNPSDFKYIGTGIIYYTPVNRYFCSDRASGWNLAKAERSRRNSYCSADGWVLK